MTDEEAGKVLSDMGTIGQKIFAEMSEEWRRKVTLMILDKSVQQQYEIIFEEYKKVKK